MKELIRDIFSAKDDSWELASILGFMAFCAYMYFSYHYYIVLSKDFDPQSFGIGSLGMATGIGTHKLMSGKADNP